MNVNDLGKFGFQAVVNGKGEVKHGYTCDLLSEVMANALTNTVWFTVQSHVNIVAVAAITGIHAIVLCNGHKFNEDTLKKAKEEGIALFTTSLSAFEAGGRLYNAGLK